MPVVQRARYVVRLRGGGEQRDNRTPREVEGARGKFRFLRACVRPARFASELLHQLDLARPPFLREERFERTVEAQDHEPALASDRSESSCRASRPRVASELKYTVVEPSAFASAAGDG